MAVQAHHLNTNSLFFTPDQLSVRSWESVMLPTDQNIDIPHRSSQLGGGLADLLYSSCSSLAAPASAAYPINLPITSTSTETATRKRARDQSCFRTEDLSSEILSQQLELDRLVAHHVEKVRWEVAQRQRRQCQAVVEAAEERLRAKQEELEAMGRLNRVLEERVSSLSLENQIWRELAWSNEAAAQALRSDLAQALTQASPEVAEAEESAESCCGAGEEDRGNRAGGSGGAGRVTRASRAC